MKLVIKITKKNYEGALNSLEWLYDKEPKWYEGCKQWPFVGGYHYIDDHTVETDSLDGIGPFSLCSLLTMLYDKKIEFSMINEQIPE